MKDLPIRFDDSLPKLVEVVASVLGNGFIESGTVLRDVQGRLAFFANDHLDANTTKLLSEKLRQALGSYARRDRVVASARDDGADTIREDSTALTVKVGAYAVRLVDRRIVGADWLRQPAPPSAPPPRVVFASLKGGVGRSTALTVVANHLSSVGKRVLTIDFDMEAPGLGSILLTEETLPEFGVIDALVEKSLSELDALFYEDLVGSSALAARGGRIDVVPAFGKRSLQNPADILAKIARAYSENIRQDGSVATLLDNVREIVDHFAASLQYDAILIDGRAGLHETTASAVLGLGADVLLFGLDEPQTFQGYSAMFAHLARLSRPGEMPEWMERITMIQGKAPADADERERFKEKCRELVKNAGIVQSSTPPLYIEQIEIISETDSKDVDWNDSLPDELVFPPEWPLPEPLAILYDGAFQHFNPLHRRDQVSQSLYRATFGQLLDRIDDIMNQSMSAEEIA